MAQKSLFNIGAELSLAFASIGLGLVEILAPLALLNVSPAFASVAPVQVGTMLVPNNLLLGAAFLLIGVALYCVVVRKRGRS